METVNKMFSSNSKFASIAPMIGPLNKIFLFLTGNKLLIRLSCKDADSGKNYKSMIEGMVASYKQKIANDLSNLKEPTSQPGWLIKSVSYFANKGSLLSTKDAVESILVANKKNIVMIKAIIPPILKTGFVPIAVVGALSAIAIPNFRAARENARKKACFANQRVLLGAIEMYNMDNKTMIESIESDTIDKLVKGSYLKNPVVCIDGGTYSSTGKLSGNGVIKCSKHGSVE